jgi:hypothetical protein
MNTLKMTLWTGCKRAGCLALVLLLPLAGRLYAQSSSSTSSSYAYSNNQYGNGQNGNGQNGNGQNGNGEYGNGPYYHPRKPRYTGHSWADHWVFEGGAGVTPPAGGTQNYANTGFNILLGFGYKFTHRISLLAEWNFNRLEVPNSLAANAAGTPGGNEHIWTADLNPKVDVLRRGRMNVYAIGGGGFSRALTNFTAGVFVPCFGFGFGFGCVGNVTILTTSTNQGNVDIGGGAEWRISQYERGDLFLEARYLKLFSPNNGLPPGPNAGLVPVTFGYRW